MDLRRKRHRFMQHSREISFTYKSVLDLKLSFYALKFSTQNQFLTTSQTNAIARSTTMQHRSCSTVGLTVWNELRQAIRRPHPQTPPISQFYSLLKTTFSAWHESRYSLSRDLKGRYTNYDLLTDCLKLTDYYVA